MLSCPVAFLGTQKPDCPSLAGLPIDPGPLLQTDNTSRYMDVVKRIDGRLGPSYMLDKWVSTGTSATRAGAMGVSGWIYLVGSIGVLPTAE